MPSTVTGRSFPGNTRLRTGRRESRSANQSAWIDTAAASSQAAGLGMPDRNTETEASTPPDSKALITQREGRHSIRQLTDALDQHGECVIGTLLITHEPAPELIVFAVEQT